MGKLARYAKVNEVFTREHAENKFNDKCVEKISILNYSWILDIERERERDRRHGVARNN